MTEHRTAPPAGDPAGPTISRRTLLAATATLAVAASVGVLGLRDAGAGQQTSPDLDAFLAVSRRLTGKDDLDPALGARLHTALVRAHPDLPHAVASLDAWLAANPGATGPALARAPGPERETGQRILRGWYLGVVGEDHAAECVAFESILAYQPVADQIVMHTFCREAPGYWAEPPTAVRSATA